VTRMTREFEAREHLTERRNRHGEETKLAKASRRPWPQTAKTRPAQVRFPGAMIRPAADRDQAGGDIPLLIPDDAEPACS